MKREIEITADGSHTLFMPELDEHYHSVNGAVQESRHVFIEAGLYMIDKEHVHILEIGFGTGLNAFLSWQEGRKSITYYTVEKYPLDEKLIRELNYGQVIHPEKADRFIQLHTAAWETEVKLSDSFTLCKMQGDSNTLPFPGQIDLVYFDAFAPDKQPDMWNQAVFDKLYACMNPGGVITTYCAKGVVRRMMQSAGFRMERIPGPPGKREMLRGTK